MKLGKKLGSGMTAEVYEISNDNVLKLFLENIPTEWVEYEFKIAHEAGKIFDLAPKSYQIETVGKRTGIVYERAFGEELSKLLQEDPKKAELFGDAMGRIHAEMHTLSTENLPPQKERYESEIKASGSILNDKLEKVLSKLASLESKKILCHGDLHLGNIMLFEKKHSVIDWMNSCSGNPAADVCRTLLMLETPYSVQTVAEELQQVVNEILTLVKKSYLKSYLSKSESTIEKIEAWRPIVAAARLKENIPGEQDWLLAMIK
jgi:thiamine kinase-like enzyme